MNQKPVYMAQLDGLRAFAVLGVLAHHLGAEYLGHPMGLAAAYGVKLFFVLSGFLITGILLRAADKVRAGQVSALQAMRRFYARRTLRIFPLYYTVVLTCCVFNVPPAREIVGWLLTYTLNIKMASQGWFEATFAHFWSLCVEEQFYVTWPWLVLFAAAKWRLRLVLAVSLIAPALRIAYILSGYTLMTGLATYISTLLCLDSLGTGALLAVLSHEGLLPTVSKYTGRRIVPVAMAGVLAAEIWGRGRFFALAFPVHDTLLALLFGWLVLRSAQGFAGTAGRILQLGPLSYVGKISYGIYVYHPLTTEALKWAVAGTSLEPLQRGWPGLCLALVAALGTASLSWHVLEKPMNDLKRHFDDR